MQAAERASALAPVGPVLAFCLVSRRPHAHAAKFAPQAQPACSVQEVGGRPHVLGGVRLVRVGAGARVAAQHVPHLPAAVLVQPAAPVKHNHRHFGVCGRGESGRGGAGRDWASQAGLVGYLYQICPQGPRAGRCGRSRLSSQGCGRSQHQRRPRSTEATCARTPSLYGGSQLLCLQSVRCVGPAQGCGAASERVGRSSPQSTLSSMARRISPFLRLAKTSCGTGGWRGGRGGLSAGRGRAHQAGAGFTPSCAFPGLWSCRSAGGTDTQLASARAEPTHTTGTLGS